MSRAIDFITSLFLLVLLVVVTLGVTAALVSAIAQSDDPAPAPTGTPVCESLEDGSTVCVWDGDGR